jgi:hypothetical protein
MGYGPRHPGVRNWPQSRLAGWMGGAVRLAVYVFARTFARCWYPGLAFHLPCITVRESGFSEVEIRVIPVPVRIYHTGKIPGK